MKRITTVLLGTLACACLSFNSYGQAFEEGTSAVTLGYGFPNMAASWMKLYTLNSSTAETGSLGPIHLKYEYGITDKLGIGASINFATAKVSDTYQETVYDEVTFESSEVTREEEIRFSSINALVRLNWHFIDHDKVDFYSGLGVGYNRNTFKYTNSDPEYDVEEEVDLLNQLYNIIPIGYEATLGLRYYFTDNIGAYMEAGWAKSLIQVGVAAKF